MKKGLWVFSAVFLLCVFVFVAWSIENAQMIELEEGIFLTVPGRPFYRDVTKEGDGWRINPHVTVTVAGWEKGVRVKIAHYLNEQHLFGDETFQGAKVWIEPSRHVKIYDKRILTLY